MRGRERRGAFTPPSSAVRQQSPDSKTRDDNGSDWPSAPLRVREPGDVKCCDSWHDTSMVVERHWLHSPPVTCISPHNAAVYTGRIVRALESLDRNTSRITTHEHTFPRINQTSPCQKPSRGRYTLLLAITSTFQAHPQHHHHHHRRQRDISQPTSTLFEHHPLAISLAVTPATTQPPTTCLSSSALRPSFARGSSPPRHVLALPFPSRMPQQHTWQPPQAPALSPSSEGSPDGASTADTVNHHLYTAKTNKDTGTSLPWPW